jgi:hypothetical protein
MWVDEILLVTGSWLLARKLFSLQLTCFFVCSTILGTAIWMIQPWYNFHFYYAIPFMLFLIHRFLETGKWSYFILSMSLLALQTLGNMPYFIPVTTVTLFGYTVFFFIWNSKDLLPRFRTICLSWKTWGALLIVGFLLAGAFAILFINTEQIVNYNYERSLSGRTTLEGFLTYGRNLNLTKWMELLWAVSPTLDLTLYMGILPLPFLIVGFVFAIRRKNAHVLMSIIALLLLSNGTAMAQLLYYIWPGMKYYRHLSLIAPLIKLFLCFLAGYGFEFFVKRIFAADEHTQLKNTMTILACLLLGLAVFLFTLSRDYPLAEKVIASITEKSTYRIDEEQKMRIFISGLTQFYDKEKLPEQIIRVAGVALMTSLALLVLVNITSRRVASFLLFLLILIHLVDLFYYKSFQLQEKSIALNEPLTLVTRFQNMPFYIRREPLLRFNTLRDQILLNLRFHPHYWSTYAFLFKDEIGHSLRTDHWLRPLNHYMKTYWDQPIGNESESPKGLSRFSSLEFPLAHPASAKIAGLAEDKIQFFKKAYDVSNEQSISDLMKDPRYTGDILFLSSRSKSDRAPVLIWSKDSLVSENSRMHLAYTVERYDSNNLVLTVNNPESTPIWLQYSDVWDPLWKVQIDNSPAPVYKANLAYKAVELKPGTHQIHFFYQCAALSALYFLWGLIALGWVILLGYFIILVASEPLNMEKVFKD